MSKKVKERYQQKLSHKEQYGGGTEYEREFLRTPETGPLLTDRLFAEIDDLEFFTPSRIKPYRDRLRRAMSGYPVDMAKISAGLSSYVNSAVEKTPELAMLTASILRAFDHCLLGNYGNTAIEDRQAIGENYFETYAWLNDFHLEDALLISPTALHRYQKHADQITQSALKAWFGYMRRKDKEHPLANSFDELLLYSGVNHPWYYQAYQDRPDKLSAYTGLNQAPFFESEVLTSYTPSYDVANKFCSGTLYHKGQRRLMISGGPDLVAGRTFSSWFAAEEFLTGQYEILCLPNHYTLLTRWEFYTDIAAGFKLERPAQPY
jgi:hypothetical protein